MATTVNAAFDQLLERLSTTPGETQAAQDYRARIEEELREEFGLMSFFRTGSYENGTSVAGHSSVDCFAVVPDVSPRPDSHQLLVAIAATLRARFPNTGVRADSPAVVLPFGRDPTESTRVIPVVEAGSTKTECRRFLMPNGLGGWMTTFPDAHAEVLHTIDRTHGGKAKPLIRLLKGWKHLRSVPISSFYLELVVAEYAKTQDTIIYDIDLRNVFEKILASGLAPYPNPQMPAEAVAPCKTAPLQIEALSLVRDAATWSREAVTLNFGGDVPAAFLRWDRVFNTHFPEFSR
jgi:hypothetical protein